MSVKKKCNIVMLSSNEKSNVNWKSIAQYPDIMGDDVKCFELGSILYNKKFVLKLQIQNRTSQIGIRPNTIKQHLYITSDDEIKEGDWYILDQGLHKDVVKYINDYGNQCKKIIATTDKSLGLPEPSEHFIKKYVEEYNKGNVITEVMVEYKTKLEWCYSHSGDRIQEKSDPFIKINSANQITISKVKDSWTREEVVYLIKNDLMNEIDIIYNGQSVNQEELDNWIEENL